jgi:c-di-GMP-binding flagellar brake protein YcgR
MNNSRKYMRISREYRIEYGPFSGLFSNAAFKTTHAKNVSGGGVLFSADEALVIGSKIVLLIHVSGWKQHNGAYIPCPDDGTELQLNAIAEIVRVEHDQQTGSYRTGARFVGRLQ